jgi:serine/threonine protein kinase
MATAAIAMKWKGRSGREYVPSSAERPRHGRQTSVRPVVLAGAGRDADLLALKVSIDGEEAGLDHIQRELRVVTELTRREAGVCPRMIDAIGGAIATGIVYEWCPFDMDRWWAEKQREPDAFGRLFALLGDVAGRMAAVHEALAAVQRQDALHGDLSPGDILLTSRGQWVISGFGHVPPRPEPGRALTDPVPDGGNYRAPEVLFGCRLTHPGAADVFSLGAIAFAMLRQRRLALDGDGVRSLAPHVRRLRTARVEAFGRIHSSDPDRFQGASFDAAALGLSDELPDADRRAVREVTRGAFAEADPDREALLAAALLPVLERALALDPARRFADAAQLSAAFDQIAKTWLELSARPRGRADARTTPTVEVEDEADGDPDVSTDLDEVTSPGPLVEPLALASPSAASAAPASTPAAPAPVVVQAPAWWAPALVLLIVLVGANLVVTTLALVVLLSS